jgi:ATP-dependent DNA helicase RecG
LPADLQTALRILVDEVNDGFRDRVVIGGLSGFFQNLLKSTSSDDVRKAAALVQDYATLDHDRRIARIDAVLKMLQETDGSQPAAPARRVDGPTTRVPKADQPWTWLAAPAPGTTLSTPIESLQGVGPVRARLYKRLGLRTIGDVLFHFPLRHIAYPPPVPIAQLFFQQEASIEGTLARLEVEDLRRGLKKLHAYVRDGTDTAHAVWLRHGVARIGVQAGQPIALSGKLMQQGRQLIFDNPDYERADGPRVHTRRMVPVHPLTAGLTEREMRNRVHWAVAYFADAVPDPLPQAIRAQHGLMPMGEALRQMHFPPSPEGAAEARRRFAFQELLTIQLVVVQRRLHAQHDPAAPLPRHDAVLRALEDGLPFTLTAAQRRVTDEILHDLALRQPMTRLLQGEVGSGKTAVAALALLNTIATGYQGALMAPTEILAEQHFGTLSRLYSAAGDQLEAVLGRRPQVTLLTGSVKGRERTRIYAEAVDGSVDVLVGTQALIQEKLEFARLGLAIVDEQHRFGVRQRVTLRRRAADTVPHLLVMTATPIPRTLALSLYGDLDLSTIDQMPPGRQFPRTVLLDPEDRGLAYERIRRAVAKGEQAFVICPLVEESEALEAKAATEEYERLRTGELKSVRLALLHGRMKAADKDATMRAFRDRQLDVLVSTAVVEVGVDIPNATVMLIEGAERFGLAQLHQFRGRIGRGERPSVCILLSDLPDPGANERLQAVVDTTDGLKLADTDLRLRGPGDFFGVRQSGLPELKVARLDDAPLVESARSAAVAILERDPELSEPEHAALREHLEAFLVRASEPG